MTTSINLAGHTAGRANNIAGHDLVGIGTDRFATPLLIEDTRWAGSDLVITVHLTAGPMIEITVPGTVTIVVKR